MTISGSFSYYSFVKLHGKKILELQHEAAKALMSWHMCPDTPEFSLLTDAISTAISTNISTETGIFVPFRSQDQGPVEFGKKAFGPSKLRKLDAV